MTSHTSWSWPHFWPDEEAKATHDAGFRFLSFFFLSNNTTSHLIILNLLNG